MHFYFEVVLQMRKPVELWLARAVCWSTYLENDLDLSSVTEKELLNPFFGTAWLVLAKVRLYKKLIQIFTYFV